MRRSGAGGVPAGTDRHEYLGGPLQRSNLAGMIVELTGKHGFNPRCCISNSRGHIFERREGRNGEANEDAVTRLRDLASTSASMTSEPVIRVSHI